MTSLSSLFVGPAVPSASTLLLLAKATFLLVAALVGTAALRKSSAGLRHLVWVITFASLVILPAVASRVPLRLAVLPAAFGEAARREANPLPDAAVQDAPVVARGTAPVRGATADRLTATQLAGDNAKGVTSPVQDGLHVSPLASLVLLWSFGAAICLAWLAHGTWTVRRIVRRAVLMNGGVWEKTLWEVADRIGLESVPRLVASHDVSMPFASGLVRPVIVLPHDAETWSDDRRTSVLLHELAHIRRRDLVGHTLGRVTCALYWFHPLVWTAAKRLRVESERACDDIALACGARPSDYAEQLLDIVTSVRRQFTPAVALAMAHRKEFEGRMLAILDPEVRRTAPTRRQTVLSIATLALMSLVVGAAVPAPRTPNDMSGSANAQDAAVPSTSQPTSDVAIRQATDKETSVELQSQTQTSISATTASDRRSASTVQSAARRQQDPDQLDKVVSALARQAAVEGSRIAGESIRQFLSGTLQESSNQKGRTDERARLLMNVLKTDTSATLRRIAAWGLGDHADEAGVASALAEALRKDSNAEVREMAAWALSEGGHERVSSEALIAAAKSDADEKVRTTAIWALGEAGDESAIDVLTEAMRSRDTKVRETAIWAIGNMEPRKAPREVITALSDSAPRIRKLAAWVLFNVADPDAVPALESALDREKDLDLRRAYVRALAATGERSTDALSKLLGSNDPEIRSLAVKALAGSNGVGPWPWPWPKPRPFP
jgi:beta-lactamase regulating signal transducer with metallopeptidase domain/HEAT repeat protein